jgi:3-phenylpropionate/trans-cinnamate dioxygenase ferredoxin subunit
MPFMKAVNVGDIPDGTGKEVTVGGKTVALFNCGGTYYAIDGLCTHRNASLADGECIGDQVACPLHGAVFHLPTGQPLSPPARVGVNTYKVQIVGNEVQVEV